MDRISRQVVGAWKWLLTGGLLLGLSSGTAEGTASTEDRLKALRAAQADERATSLALQVALEPRKEAYLDSRAKQRFAAGLARKDKKAPASPAGAGLGGGG